MKSKISTLMAANDFVTICRDNDNRAKIYYNISSASKYRIEQLTLRYTTSIWFTSQGLHLFIYNEMKG